ncbi:hypothetical protein LTR08_008641 [Meristemomyces frigidus]|nr:hypothetical protein LTR08_008641 [Meristemomyces frigidus]
MRSVDEMAQTREHDDEARQLDNPDEEQPDEGGRARINREEWADLRRQLENFGQSLGNDLFPQESVSTLVGERPCRIDFWADGSVNVQYWPPRTQRKRNRLVLSDDDDEQDAPDPKRQVRVRDGKIVREEPPAMETIRKEQPAMETIREEQPAMETIREEEEKQPTDDGEIDNAAHAGTQTAAKTKTKTPAVVPPPIKTTKPKKAARGVKSRPNARKPKRFEVEKSEYFTGKYNEGYTAAMPGVPGRWEYYSYGEGSSEELAHQSLGRYASRGIALPEKPTADEIAHLRGLERGRKKTDGVTAGIDIVWVPDHERDVLTGVDGRQALVEQHVSGADKGPEVRRAADEGEGPAIGGHDENVTTKRKKDHPFWEYLDEDARTMHLDRDPEKNQALILGDPNARTTRGSVAKPAPTKMAPPPPLPPTKAKRSNAKKTRGKDAPRGRQESAPVGSVFPNLPTAVRSPSPSLIPTTSTQRQTSAPTRSRRGSEAPAEQSAQENNAVGRPVDKNAVQSYVPRNPIPRPGRGYSTKTSNQSNPVYRDRQLQKTHASDGKLRREAQEKLDIYWRQRRGESTPSPEDPSKEAHAVEEDEEDGEDEDEGFADEDEVLPKKKKKMKKSGKDGE